VALEVENSELDSELEQKRNVKLGLISQLEQCELEMKDMNGILSEIQDACDKKQEDINRLQEQLQAKQYVQAKFKSFWQWCDTYLKLLACQLLCWSEHVLKLLI
jgi:chromosome segregation ATPase